MGSVYVRRNSPINTMMWLRIITICLCLGVAWGAPRDTYKDLLYRKYCRVRPVQQCCPGRDDTCTMPILNTICYCDMFCNRTISDCCPDFWGHCIGIDPPFGSWTLLPQHPTISPETGLDTVVNNCYHEGKTHKPGNKIKANCNNCTCVEVPSKKEFNWKCTQKICVVRKELIERINQGNYGWKATNYTFLWGMSLQQAVSYRLGTERPKQPVKQMSSLRVQINDILPDKFDARSEWPGLIHPVQDQGNCGASWAFSTTSVAADRLTLHSRGFLRDMLSAQNLISCDKDHMQKGCNGGHIDRAWWFLRKIGVVSEDCYPYESGQTDDAGKCFVSVSIFRSPTKRIKCPNSKAQDSLLYQSTPPYRIAPIEREIMKEIMENGPVQATMEVKEDFFLYKGGVYSSSLPGTYLPPNHHWTGFHSVRILGWGTDYSSGKPVKYWLCANSWGPKWGEDGYFKIARGVNECQIESFVVGVWGKVNGRQVINRRKRLPYKDGQYQRDRPDSRHHHRHRHHHDKFNNQ